MEQAVKRQARRNRPSLPLALLAAGVVLSLFGIVAASRGPQAAAPPLPEFTVSTAVPLITSPPSEAETPAPYVPDEAEVEMLARVLWGEARGVPSDMEKAAVVWCVLNRVDAARWPDTVAGVVTEPSQFAGYSPDYPATEELKTIKSSWKVAGGGTVFCNPPYGREIGKWVRKAYEEAQAGTPIVLLIPARTDTTYFHEFIYHKAEVRFIRGRLRFTDEDGNAADPAPFPSMLVIYNGEAVRNERREKAAV